MQVHAVNPRLTIANEAERIGQLAATLTQALTSVPVSTSHTQRSANLVLMTSRVDYVRSDFLPFFVVFPGSWPYLFAFPSEVSAASVFSDALPYVSRYVRRLR